MEGYIEKIILGLIGIITGIFGWLWKDMSGRVKDLDNKTDTHATDIELLKQQGVHTDINIKSMGDEIVKMIRAEVFHASEQKEYFKEQLQALDKKIEKHGGKLEDLSNKILELIAKYEVIQNKKK